MSETGVLAAEHRARATTILDRAHWAASEFATFDRARVQAIARAVADVGFASAQRYAEWAVRETGFGVVEHKRIKNELCSRGLYEHYESSMPVEIRIDHERGVVEVPRPAGVVFALTPSTNPVSTVYFKVLLAVMARCAVVVSPHPFARECCVDAVRTLAAAAGEAGCPDGAIQVVEHPSLDLIDAYMRHPRTDVILATGGTAVVRAAYSSGNPAIGVGPGNAPAVVDASADLRKAAQALIDSKTFDNSVLCTNESVIVAEESIADRLGDELRKAGAHLCSTDEADRLRAFLFPSEGRLNTAAIGRPATWIAEQAGINVKRAVGVLVAPIEIAGSDEPLSTEKLCPVLGMLRAPDRQAAIRLARAVLRHTGAGHSAAVHTSDPQTVLSLSMAVPVLRIVVNAPCSQAAAGFGSNLAPSMTIGTGFFGRSSVGGNIGPADLVNWTRISHASDVADSTKAYVDLKPLAEARPDPLGSQDGEPAVPDDLRALIRDLVMQELSQFQRKGEARDRG
jgi:acetaldehyde dehydrogenase / alcohol dehydrogenase